MSPSPSRTSRRRGLAVLAVTAGLAAVGLSGCGGDDPSALEEVTTSSGPSTTSSPTTVAASVTAAPLPGKSSPTSQPTTASFVGGTTQVSTPATPRAHLTNITVSAEPGFDRVVFTFANLLPGYRIGPVSGPFRFDPSDNPVPVVGPDYVETYFNGGRADMSTGQATYTGANHIPGPPNAVVVTEVVLVGDFEDQLRWIIGTSAPAQYLVTTLTSPFRVVVDLAPQ